MREGMRVVVSLAVTLLLSARAEAGELRYAWKKGDVHRYQFEEAAHFKSLPGSAPMNEIVTVRSVFAERVLAARPDAADLELVVEKLEVHLGKRSIGALDRLLPPEARRLPATVDPRGHVALQRVVAAYLHEGRLYIGVRDLAAGPAGSGGPAEAWGTADRQRVTPFASFDPRTGKLSGSSGPADRRAAIELPPDAPGVDAVPRRLFDMLEFPDSTAGSKGATPAGPGVGTWRLAPPSGPVARIHVTSAASRDDGRARAMLRAAGPTGALADVTARFDAAAGELIEARGTVVTRTSMKVSSRVVLTRL